MSSLSSSSAGRIVPPAASALLERHGAALRGYLGALPGADAARVEQVVAELARDLDKGGELDDDPTVWLFAHGRQRLLGAGQRGDVLRDVGADTADEEESSEGQDDGVAVHRAFARLTSKQQEALRLRFQFGFNPEEMARVTGLSLGGVEGLFEHAMGRIVQAMPAAPGKSAVRITDPRIIAYALDEMGAAEKKALVEHGPDGKGLLETADTIRRAVRTLTQILQNGAPPPRRRKRHGGMPVFRVVAILAGLLIAAGAVWWFVSGRTSPDAEVVADNVPTVRAVRREGGAVADEAHGQPGEQAHTAQRERRRGLRPGEADWERKRFGQGHGRSAAQTGEGGGASGESSSDGPVPVETESSAAPAPTDAPPESEPEAGGREPRDEPPAVVWPGGAGAGGAPVSGHAEAPSAGGPGAWAGSPQARTRVVQSGEPLSVTLPSSAGTARAPEPGLKDLQRDLARGQWPSADRVRPGALLRQAPPEWPAPGGQPVPLAVRMEMAPSPFAPGRQVVRVMVQAKPAPPPVRPPANIVLAIDVSDSMNTPNRLPLVQAGLRLLAERLRPDDRVAVVTYAAEAREVRASEPVGAGGRDLRDTLAGLSAQGRTNGYDGLTLAYDVARRARASTGLNAVILCTDGNFNLGETDERMLAGIAARFAAAGIRLSVFGFGRSDRNDLRLELLAQQGGGRSCYVNTEEEAERLLAGQIDGLLEPVAREVNWRVDWNPGRVTDVSLLGGQEGELTPEVLPGRKLTALYEVNLRPEAAAETDGLGKVRVDYFAAGEKRPALMQQTLAATAGGWNQTGPGFRFAVAAAELGRILQSDQVEAKPALARLETWVAEHLPDDAGGYRRDLLDTIALARSAAAQ